MVSLWRYQNVGIAGKMVSLEMVYWENGIWPKSESKGMEQTPKRVTVKLFKNRWFSSISGVHITYPPLFPMWLETRGGYLRNTLKSPNFSRLRRDVARNKGGIMYCELH